MTVELGGVTVLNAQKLLSEHPLEGVGDHGHDHIEVYLYKDGGRQGVEVKELDSFGDDIGWPRKSGARGYLNSSAGIWRRE